VVGKQMKQMAKQVRDTESKPDHVAIIMDGNGRWARKRRLPRLAGHQEGARAVEKVIRAAGESGIPFLSLFAFSTENWKRPKNEVDGLIGLLKLYLRSKLEELRKNRIRMVFSGRIGQLPADLKEEISLFEEATATGDTLTVVICLNYGGRQEIVDAVNRMISQGLEGPVDEKMISSSLYLPWVPDPDLVIRTSGEMRISNFLLWGSAYSEFYFTDTLWPDFDGGEFRKALENYSKRERRYGSV
jgi:undecaprenyl diphosphate synthase